MQSTQLYKEALSQSQLKKQPHAEVSQGLLAAELQGNESLWFSLCTVLIVVIRAVRRVWWVKKKGVFYREEGDFSCISCLINARSKEPVEQHGSIGVCVL